MIRRLTVLLVLGFGLVASAWGQVHIDARGLGLCNAYTVSSRGVSALGYNPANLGYTEDLSFSADLLGVDLIAWNNFM